MLRLSNCVETADVAFVKLQFETADVAFVKLLGNGSANVTLIVRFVNGADILEEFIVPSTSLPSITPDGSVEFKVSKHLTILRESPLYKNAPVTLSKV